MPQTPREIVKRCLTFDFPERLPRDLWLLPWTENHYPEAVKDINDRFPSDFTRPDYLYPASSRIKGDPYKIGEYTDEWGCIFTNIQAGMIGEVKKPIIEDIADWKLVKPPYEQLPTDTKKPYEKISRYYDNTDKFVIAACCPRPWERYQFIRGTMNSMMDVMMPDDGCRDLIKLIHDFYMKELEFWVKADVDGIMFMDDWGSQNQLLIPPYVWQELFKPLYKDYCDIIHANNKFAFMHSDGYITDIYEDLINVGVDALNSQLFCMNFDDLVKKAKGNITFWGEIDRQHILPDPDPQVGRDAVQKLLANFYDPAGGLIAQLEFGGGANPKTILAIYEEWEKFELEQKL